MLYNILHLKLFSPLAVIVGEKIHYILQVSLKQKFFFGETSLQWLHIINEIEDIYKIKEDITMQ